MKKLQAVFQLFLLVLALTGCKSSRDSRQANASAPKGLKDHYSNYFTMGVAVSPQALKSADAALVLREFNSLTAENAMKSGPIHPRENFYNWAGGDSIAAFAKRNNMKMRGHCLVWHNQTPRWFFTDSVTGKPVTRELLLQRMKDHITAVVSRYKGTVYAWDVVNEAISDKADEFYRPSEYLKIIGEDFIAKAFEYAHAADPDALLFYNDYNEINPVKRAKIIQMIKDLRAKGIPVHGVGLQAHWAINEPAEAQLESTLKDFSELGLKLHITELDVSVYPKEHNARDRKPSDYDTTFSADKEARQQQVYKMIFEKFRKYKEHIQSVTFWNITDRSSWLDNFPVRGRKDYPLLFDKNGLPKKAYGEVVNYKKGF